jgi:hypothetical protein
VDFEPGDLVERRYGHGESRFGQITGRVREGYDAWYVTCEVGMTFCDNGRDLRTANQPAGRPRGRLDVFDQSLDAADARRSQR